MLVKEFDVFDQNGNLFSTVPIKDAIGMLPVYDSLEKAKKEAGGKYEIKEIKRTLSVMQQSEQFICRDCGKNTIEWADGICEDCTLKGFS